MDPEEQTLNLAEYLKILRRRRVLMILTFLLVVASTGLITTRMTPIYEGVTKVEVQPVSSSSSETSRVLEALVDPSRALQTQVELIKSKAVLEKAAKALLLPTTQDLEDALEVELIRDTQIVEIRVEHERPDEAKQWSDAVATAYVDYRRERAVEQAVLATQEISRQAEEVKAQLAESDRVLGDLKGATTAAKAERDRLAADLATEEAEFRAPQPSPAPPNRSRLNRMESLRLRISELNRRISDYESGGSVPQGEREELMARLTALESQRGALPAAETLRQGGGTIIQAAELPTEPVRPKLLLNLLLATVLGSLLGVGLAFVAESLDDRIRSPEEVEERVGAPVVGYVPFVEEWAKNPDPVVAIIDDPSSGAAEAFRTLRTNIKFLAIDRPLRTILVTSSVAEEGKSTIAANLAVAFAQGGTKTILVSGDLRRPSLHKLFKLPDEKGILDALDPNVPLERSLQTNGVGNFRLLSAGGLPPNPTEILASARFGELLLKLGKAADLVVIDATPVLGLADAGALASRVDGIIFVVDSHEATRRNITHAADQLRKAGGKIAGVVMNAVEAREGYGYYYQYYYYQYAGDEKRAREPGKSQRASTEKSEIS